MIERTTHNDVTAYRLSWWRSRAIGYSVNVYVVRGVLIDSGFAAAQHDVAQLVKLERVRGAFITHQHEDHAGNAAWLAHHGVPLAMADATHESIRHPHRIGLYRHITWRAMRPLSMPFARFADDDFALVPTPGHSPDHHAVWDAQTHTLFAGDLFLGVKVRHGHSYESPRTTVASLRDVIARAPSRVFCAHRGLLPDGTAMLETKLRWMEDVIARVESMALEGARVGTIRDEVLGKRDSTHWISAGDYSPDNLVRAIARDAGMSLRA